MIGFTPVYVPLNSILPCLLKRRQIYFLLSGTGFLAVFGKAVCSIKGKLQPLCIADGCSQDIKRITISPWVDLALRYSCLGAGRHTGREIIEINLNTRGTRTFGLSWDWILSSNKIELEWVAATLEKQRKEKSEGEDYKVMLFTFSSDLSRNAAKEKKSDSAKRGVKEQWWWDKGTWWGIASIN